MNEKVHWFIGAKIKINSISKEIPAYQQHINILVFMQLRGLNIERRDYLTRGNRQCSSSNKMKIKHNLSLN